MKNSKQCWGNTILQMNKKKNLKLQFYHIFISENDTSSLAFIFLVRKNKLVCLKLAIPSWHSGRMVRKAVLKQFQVLGHPILKQMANNFYRKGVETVSHFVVLLRFNHTLQVYKPIILKSSFIRAFWCAYSTPLWGLRQAVPPTISLKAIPNNDINSMFTFS